MIAENSSLPKFELSDANGSVVKSSDLKGKKCVIYFYPKDFTPGCTIEADEFSKDYKKFQKAGIEIAVIDVIPVIFVLSLPLIIPLVPSEYICKSFPSPNVACAKS